MVRLLLLFFATSSLTTGFQTQPTRLETLYTDGASKTALCHQSECSNEVTRRDAILTSAAAVASLTVATSVPASAAVKVDINNAINDIELEYADSVNTNGAPEKHLPTMTFDRTGSVKAVVNHVMDPEKPHYIEYMWIKDMKSGKILASKQFQPTDPSPPSITATNVKVGSLVKAFLFCNLHGLWQGETMTV